MSLVIGKEMDEEKKVTNEMEHFQKIRNVENPNIFIMNQKTWHYYTLRLCQF